MTTRHEVCKRIDEDVAPLLGRLKPDAYAGGMHFLVPAIVACTKGVIAALFEIAKAIREGRGQ